MEATFEDYTRVLRAADSAFGRKRVLVLGDLMLDRYLWGEVDRISPEAPVPVVRIRNRTEVGGGAANVAANFSGLGIPVSVAGLVGNDASRDALMTILQQQEVDFEAVVAVPDRPTITKTRVVGGHQQMLRMDEEHTAAPDPHVESHLIERVLAKLDTVSAIILSDYAKGALSARTCRTVIRAARDRNIPVLVDPKGTDYAKYAGATYVTPNLKELALATGLSTVDEISLIAAAVRMRRELEITGWAVTQGEHGITIIDDGPVRRFPAAAREVFDVSGAGDTVIAALAAGVLGGLPLDDSVRLANLAAGIVVGKVGTSPLQRTELLAALQKKMQSEQTSKIMELSTLLARVAEWRARGERIVFTNGCFDLIHAGHVTYLERARLEGSRLVIGLNTDSSVRALKGTERPILPEWDRARVLASLSAVDAVVLFEDSTPIDLIRSIRPDVLVKGSDYSEAEVVGASETRSWQGRVVLIPQLEGRSTSHIVSRIRGTA